MRSSSSVPARNPLGTPVWMLPRRRSGGEVFAPVGPSVLAWSAPSTKSCIWPDAASRVAATWCHWPSLMGVVEVIVVSGLPTPKPALLPTSATPKSSTTPGYLAIHQALTGPPLARPRRGGGLHPKGDGPVELYQARNGRVIARAVELQRLARHARAITHVGAARQRAVLSAQHIVQIAIQRIIGRDRGHPLHRHPPFENAGRDAALQLHAQAHRRGLARA